MFTNHVIHSNTFNIPVAAALTNLRWIDRVFLWLLGEGFVHWNIEGTAPLINTLLPVNVFLGPVVQSVDSAIHRINHYPVDKCWQNKLRYPPDSDLSGE